MIRRALQRWLAQPPPVQAPPTTAAIQEEVDVLKRAFQRLQDEFDKTLEDVRAERARIKKAVMDMKLGTPAPDSAVPFAPGSTNGGGAVGSDPRQLGIPLEVQAARIRAARATVAGGHS